MLDKLKKWIRKKAGPSVAAFLEVLAHQQNVSSLSLFGRYYFGRFSCELAQLVPPPYSQGRSTWYSDRLHNFCHLSKYLYVNRLWNYLPIECFPLTFDLSDLKSRTLRHLSPLGSSKTCPVCFNLYLLLFLVTTCH